jgi:hypothetical protein
MAMFYIKKAAFLPTMLPIELKILAKILFHSYPQLEFFLLALEGGTDNFVRKCREQPTNQHCTRSQKGKAFKLLHTVPISNVNTAHLGAYGMCRVFPGTS